jgi:hypothetical protein
MTPRVERREWDSNLRPSNVGSTINYLKFNDCQRFINSRKFKLL